MSETLVLVCAAAAFWAAGSLYHEPLPRVATAGWLVATLDGLSPASRRFVALALIARQSVRQPNPADWDTALIVQTLQPADETVIEGEALLVAARHYAAIGERERALELLQRSQSLFKVAGTLSGRVAAKLLQELAPAESSTAA